MPKQQNRFIDEYQNTHLRKNILGRGGQGIVYRTSDTDVAIKLVLKNEKQISDKTEIEKYQKKIRNIRLLPIPENINITKPMAMLKNNAGYVMHLLNDMISFSRFWPDPKSLDLIVEFPDWLRDVPEEISKLLIHYLNTGGLRRRLIALANCASILTELHSTGLIYGDISSENVFLSKHINSNQVWLIDPDNIRFFKDGSKLGVFTPKYGAPELVQGKSGCSFKTDCHSFSVLAFWLLTMNHPFIGDYVLDGGGDWAECDDNEDLDEKAYAGLIPWIDDDKDDSNYTTNGLPRSLVLTEKIQKLFQLTFGDGRKKPQKRPAMYHWPKAFMEAHDTVIECKDCSMSFYFNEELRGCPYCNTDIKEVISVKTYLYDIRKKQTDKLYWIYYREIKNEKIKVNLPHRAFNPFSNKSNDHPILSISKYKTSIILKKLDSDVIICDSKNLSRKLAETNKYNKSSLSKGIKIVVDNDIPMLIEIKRIR